MIKLRKKIKKCLSSKKLSKSKKTVRSLDFLISKARLVFIKLRQALVKTPILYHFDLKYHIWIKIDISGYTIDGVLS